MAICGNNITGAKNGAIEVEVSPNGQVKATLIVKPFATPQLCNTLSLSKTSVPAALDPNVLISDKTGAYVLAGKTQSILLFKDCSSNELKGDIIIAPAPVPSNPCDPVQPDRNVFQSTAEGVGVWAQGLPADVTNDSATASQCVFTYRDCSTGEVRAFLRAAPELDNGVCAPRLNAAGKVILRNAFQATETGAAVYTGLSADGNIETYVDCDTKELHARLVIQEDTSCNSSQTNSRGKNALSSNGAGVAVLTGEYLAGGFRSFYNCATKELLGEVILKPDPPAANCTNNPKTNALRIYDDGLGVIVGPNTDGCIETFVNCSDNMLLAKLIIKPNEANGLGSSVASAQNGLQCTTDGAAVMVDMNAAGNVHLFVDPVSNTVKGRVIVKPRPTGANCDPAVLKNALRSTVEGLEVPFGDTNSIDLVVDCPTGELRGNLRLDPDTAKLLEVGPNGLKLKLSAKDPANQCDNGLFVHTDGLSAYGANCQLAGHADKATATHFTYSPGGNTRQEGATISFTVHNNTCKTAAGLILFRAPSGSVVNSTPDNNSADIAYEGSYTVGSVTNAVGEVYASKGYSNIYSFTGQTEYRQVTIAPGGSFTASMKVVATFSSASGATTGVINAICNSYSIDAILYNVDCTKPMNE